jgi:hypothetical protein
MSRKICLLSHEEVKQWREGIAPHCPDHRHVKRVDAMEMTHHGDYSPYSERIAQWVGPRHIELLSTWSWKPRPSGRPLCHGAPTVRTLQLVEGA